MELSFFRFPPRSPPLCLSLLTNQTTTRALLTPPATHHQADGDDDGYTKGHNGGGPATIAKRRSRGRAAAALLLLAGAAAAGWAVTTGALRLPAGDMLSRSALKSEVAKQVRSLGETLDLERKRRERQCKRSHWFFLFSGFGFASTLLWTRIGAFLCSKG